MTSLGSKFTLKCRTYLFDLCPFTHSLADDRVVGEDLVENGQQATLLVGRRVGGALARRRNALLPRDAVVGETARVTQRVLR